jgi:Domain of unknown function (DUF4382)
MSVRRKSIEYAAAAIVVSAAIIAASILYMGIPIPSPLSTSSAQGGQPGTLAIQLTDPPQVPHLTTSLNLTFSSLSLLVGEPTGTQGQLSTSTVAFTPSGGSQTIDLLNLQNVSQTIALVSLPTGSVLYSVTFAVSGIKIDVNNTISAVSLATGNSFTVTIAHPSAYGAGDFAILQLNPVVVNTPSGYQLIPSSVGVMGHGEGPDYIGQKHTLNNGDSDNLKNAQGSVGASIVSLSVDPQTDVTTFTVQVSNSANVPVFLNAIGLHGNFTVVGDVCQTFASALPYHQGGSGGDQQGASDHGAGLLHCVIPLHLDEIVFVPVAPSESTTTSTTSTASVTSTATSTTTQSCASGQMTLVNGIDLDLGDRGLSLGAGQCVLLTFVGSLSFGNSNFVLLPSTSTGQVYVLHVIGSNGANQQVVCTLPLGPSSCKISSPQPDSQDW